MANLIPLGYCLSPFSVAHDVDGHLDAHSVRELASKCFRLDRTHACMRGGSENDEPLPHPSKRKTSSVADHHPGPLSEPVAPGTKLSCIPSVI